MIAAAAVVAAMVVIIVMMVVVMMIVVVVVMATATAAMVATVDTTLRAAAVASTSVGPSTAVMTAASTVVLREEHRPTQNKTCNHGHSNTAGSLHLSVSLLFLLVGRSIGSSFDLCDRNAVRISRWNEGEGIFTEGGCQIPGKSLAVLWPGRVG